MKKYLKEYTGHAIREFANVNSDGLALLYDTIGFLVWWISPVEKLS